MDMNLAPSPETEILFENESACPLDTIHKGGQQEQSEAEGVPSIRLDLAAIVIACLCGWALLLAGLLALIF